MRRAVVIGATGQIGRAAVTALAGDGWAVTALSRRDGRDEGWPGEVRAVAADREDDSALAEAIGDGCDVLVDVVAYGAAHARQLTALSGRIGSAVVISSAEVYEDDKGRGFATMGNRTASRRIRYPSARTSERFGWARTPTGRAAAGGESVGVAVPGRNGDGDSDGGLVDAERRP